MAFDKFVMPDKYYVRYFRFPMVCIGFSLFTLNLSSAVPPALKPSTSSLQANQQEERETIATAIADLQSPEFDRRRGAIMLLAKYPNHPDVIEEIVSSLKDDHQLVRRAAAVSLVENLNQLTSPQATQLALALQDTDSEVRETVAAVLPQIFLIRSSRINRLGIGYSQPMDNLLKEDEVRTVCLNALKDPDPLIRSSIIASLRYLQGNLPQDILIALLDDPNPEVRVSAYETVPLFLPINLFIEAASKRHPETDLRCRLVLAETLAIRTSPEAEELLHSLSEDISPSVRLEAELSRFLSGLSQEVPALVINAIDSNELETAKIYRIFHHLRSLPSDLKRKEAESFLASDNPIARAQATQTWLQSFPGFPDMDRIVGFLNDTVPEVRTQAVSFLRSTNKPIPLEILETLPENPYEDVRQLALHLARFNKSDDQSNLALSLLLDPIPQIRQSSLQALARLKPQNWQRIFKASLRDPDPFIRKTSADALLNQLGADGREIAASFASEKPEESISNYIQQRLK